MNRRALLKTAGAVMLLHVLLGASSAATATGVKGSNFEVRFRAD